MAISKDLHIVVKIGGAVAEDANAIDHLFEELRDYTGRAVLVHGGGAAVTRHSRLLGLESIFSAGVRITSAQEMEVVDMVLAGRVNTQLVRRAVGRGIGAAGLTGADCALFRGRLVDPLSGSRTATVEAVDLRAVDALLSGGILPIVASVGLDATAEAVNINADEAAQALAVAIARSGREATLCYLSDIPGVLNGEKSVISDLPVPQIDRLIADGVVQGGMTAKLRSTASAIASGLRGVIIGGYREPGDLHKLLDRRSGTTIHATSEGV